jgi:hypothetical protein
MPDLICDTVPMLLTLQDVKSPNVLLAADFTAKISDVGLAKLQNKDYLSAQQQVGTFTWSVSAWTPTSALVWIRKEHPERV